MNKLTCLILGIIFLSASCIPEHHNCCVLPKPSAQMNAQKNGTQWSPLFVAGALSPTDSLTLVAVSVSINNGAYIKLDTLNFRIQYFGLGTYKLKANQAFYGTFNSAGAVAGYKLDTTFNNQVIISTYQKLDNPATMNPNQVMINGNFNIKFTDPKNPAGISFLNGGFYSTMNQ